jgi:hypothetical protein
VKQQTERRHPDGTAFKKRSNAALISIFKAIEGLDAAFSGVCRQNDGVPFLLRQKPNKF